jgi:hypothetical protein
VTLINLRGLIDALPAPAPIDSATVRIQRWAGHAPAVLIDGPGITFPANVAVTISDGTPDETIDVPATDGRYCIRWQITAPIRGARPVYRYTSIPVAGPVDFADLIDVDPNTFEPSGTATAAWIAALREVAQLAAEVAEDAADAGTSAFHAGAAAASALGHANAADNARADAVTARNGAVTARTGAETAATAADGSRAAAVTARTGAETAATAADGSRAAAVTARTGAETAATAADGSRAAAVTARTGAETARTGAETAATAAETARNLALAGQFNGSSLNAQSDLNALTTPGVYRQGSGGQMALGFPLDAFYGVIVVYSRGTGGATQIAYKHNALGGDARRYFMRVQTGAGWSPWGVYSTLRVDQTAGRAFYAFDEINNRDQLIYGDTGERAMETYLINGWTANNVRLRRVGPLVALDFDNLQGPAQTSQICMAVPAGFRSTTFPPDRFALHTVSSAPVVMFRGYVDAVGQVYMVAPSGSGGLYGSITWFSNEPWPTALPGAAAGSIPS